MAASCPNCHELTLRVEALEQVLGVVSDLGEGGVTQQIRRAFGLTPGQARIVSRLFAAEGRLVPCDALEGEANAHRWSRSLPVQVSRIRANLGYDAIATHRHPSGYSLSTGGLIAIRQALQPAQVAA